MWRLSPATPTTIRHGVVAKSVGLLPPNHYLAVCIHYLFGNRPHWNSAIVYR